MLVAAVGSTSDLVVLFAAGGLVLYIAARAAVDALTSADDPSPGRLAIGHWIPIAMTALLATAAGRAEIGVGLAMATSVAAVAMVLGVLVCMSAEHEGPRLRTHAWPFVVPASVLALLAGFSGSLTWWHALMLLGLGGCVHGVWQARKSEAPVPVESVDGATAPSQPRRGDLRGVQLTLAILLAAAGGWLAYRATTVADDRTRVATSGLIAAAVVSPLLVLPMLGTGAIAAHHGKLGAATAGIVGLVLLNLCALLPMVILTHYGRQVVVDWHKIQPALASAATTVPTTDEVYQLRAMPFPLAVWRVDTVLLIVLGLLLIPVSLGRVTLRKPEGLALAVVYAVYLVISTALAIRL